ncbi:MAG: hypothetical protein KGL95_01355 [Patescibacteria group bacterium]|nr:hypothetical protein [Patescibacteria group bacterium]
MALDPNDGGRGYYSVPSPTVTPTSTPPPLAFEGKPAFSTNTYNYLGNTSSNSFMGLKKLSGKTAKSSHEEKIIPTPTPTTIPLNDSSVQQIIQIIDQQFSQITQTLSPTQTTEQQNQGVTQTNANNTTPSPTNANTNPNINSDTNSHSNTNPTPTLTNTSQQTQNSQGQQDNSSTSNSEQTFLPSNSIPTTQQTLNNVLKDQNIHVKIENQGGQTIITAVNDQGTIIQISNDLVNKLTDLLTQDAFPKIVKVNESDYLFKKGNAVAESNLPLKFESGDNIPLMTIDNNDTPISVLPDQAASRIQTTDLLTTLGNTSFFKYMFPSYTPPPSIINMNLTVSGGQPVYTFSGTVEKKLFGFLPIGVQRIVLISAETGLIQGVQQNSFSAFLDKLSK